MKDERKTQVQLIEELNDLRRQLTGCQVRSQALDQFQQAVRGMQKSDDIDRVVENLGTCLASMGIHFLEYGIVLIDDASTPLQITSRTRDVEGEWRAMSSTSPDGIRDYVQRWQRQEIFYRRDLEDEDAYGLGKALKRRIGLTVRSVIDFPFSHGCLAINSDEANAFGEQDIKDLQVLADILSGSFQRQEELKRLEAHNWELESEISERKKTEETLRESEERLQKAFDEIEALKERLEAENTVLRQEIQTFGHPSIIGESAVMKSMMAQVAEVAETNATVLVFGETGTGKELVARAIHDLSSRRERPFVAINCAAIPTALVESELFGREKGAYTGALTRQAGRFEVADGSTLFLDEIGELPQEIQIKLLRVLEEGEFERIGSSKTMRVDVRIVAASNKDLEEEVAAGRFRADLFYRLNVYPLNLPPLRERTGDIPVLMWAFVSEFAARMGKRIDSIPPDAVKDLERYSWPGNVRELRNIIERSMIRASSSKLRIELPKSVSRAAPSTKTLAEAERQHILEALEAANWRVRGKRGAAERLGLPPSTLESRMKKLDIRRPIP